MRTYSIMAMTALVSSVCFAADPIGFGEKLVLKSDLTGKPAVGIVYSYDSDWRWQITFTSTKTAQNIEKLPQMISWDLWDVTTHSEPTRRTYTTDRSSIVSGQLRVDKASEVAALLAAPQTNLIIVFSASLGEGYGRQNIFYLPLGEICSNHPSHVKDLTKPTQPACVVSVADLADPKCVDLKNEMLGLVKEGTISCADGNEIYHSENCTGDIGC